MIYILTALLVFGVDRFFKTYVDNNKTSYEEEPIFGGKIVITKSYNKGAFMNFMDKSPRVIQTVSCMLLGAILFAFASLLSKKNDRLMKLGTALLAGGAASNVYDRVTKEAVIDYFSIRIKKLEKLKKVIFNIGDMAIFIGGILIVIASFFRNKRGE